MSESQIKSQELASKFFLSIPVKGLFYYRLVLRSDGFNASRTEQFMFRTQTTSARFLTVKTDSHIKLCDLETHQQLFSENRCSWAGWMSGGERIR